MRPDRTLWPAALAVCAALSAPAMAQSGLPPAAEAHVADIATALDDLRVDGYKIVDAVRALKGLVDADPSLAGPLRQRLDGIAANVRTGAPNTIADLILPFLLLGDRPGGEPEVLGRDNLRFRTPAGPPPGEAFLSNPSRPVVTGSYTVEWTDFPKLPDMRLTVALAEGIHFAIASNDCPERPSRSGNCTVSVRFEMGGNGIRQDDLTATYGPLKAHAPLYGQATGFAPADPRIIPPADTTVRLDAARPGGDVRLSFSVENHGPGALPPFMPRTWSRESLKSKAWAVDPSSTCPSVTTASGESCSVVLGFYPEYNIQESVLFSVPDPRGRTDGSGEAFGYARGFSEDLPPGLLTNGDPCPAVGAAAEIVVMRHPVGPSGGTFNQIDTTACTAWQPQSDGTLHCADSGIREGGSTRTWARSALDRPMRLTTVRPAEAHLACHDGAIERVWIDIPIAGGP